MTVNGTTRIISRSIKDLVYDELKKDIMKGILKPGERLIEQELSDRYQISRTPLREAFQKLEADELVEKVHSGGVRVTLLSEKEVRDIYDLRRIIDCKIIKDVTINCSSEYLKELEKIIKQLEQEINKADNDIDFEEENRIMRMGLSFHKKLYQLYGNKACIKVLDDLQIKLNRYNEITAKNNLRVKQSAMEHIKIFNLIKEGKAEEVGEEIYKHLKNGEEATIKALNS